MPRPELPRSYFTSGAVDAAAPRRPCRIKADGEDFTPTQILIMSGAFAAFVIIALPLLLNAN